MLESELPAALREDLAFLETEFQRLLDMGYDPFGATRAYMRLPANKKLPRKTALVGNRRRPAPQALVIGPVVPPYGGSSLFAMSGSVGVRLDQPAASLLPPLQFHDRAYYCVPYSLFNLVPLSEEEREHILADLGGDRGKRCDVKHLQRRRKKGCGWSVENLRRQDCDTERAVCLHPDQTGPEGEVYGGVRHTRSWD
jgi:hypothetical protein